MQQQARDRLAVLAAQVAPPGDRGVVDTCRVTCMSVTDCPTTRMNTPLHRTAAGVLCSA
jgi:hypothetical protein